MNTEEYLEYLRGAVLASHGKNIKLQEQLDEALEDLSEAQGTLDQAKALATEIERRFALRLDPGPTEQDFRELLQLLTEGS